MEMIILLGELSWVGTELLGLLIGIVLVIAFIALISMGVMGLGLVLTIGLVLALLFNSVLIAIPLFNSVLIAIPLLMLVGLGWLLNEHLSV